MLELRCVAASESQAASRELSEWRQSSSANPRPHMSVLVASTPQQRRSRALSLGLAAASKHAPLLDIPLEVGLAILELGLAHTPSSTLASVSRAFSDIIACILYRNVVLDTPAKLALFARTVRGAPTTFIDTHVKTLAITLDWRSLSATSRMDIESVIAGCRGARILSLPRPGVLARAVSRDSRVLPTEITIQSFDLDDDGSLAVSALPLASSLTHLRVSEPGDTWQSPLSILFFFGCGPQLSYLALSRRVHANEDNDAVFVDEVQTILESRPRLKMLVVRVFPAYFPFYCGSSTPLEESPIWESLSVVAERDPRLVLVTAGFEGCKTPWAHVCDENFWESCRDAWERRSPPA
uniref:F-box domain-containing protein n=1 Tax=Mycena chlorophos TaxID=658473 RepID=A0ABQ0M3L3_MYCCL|nr:predicted protein [Mycena chlorophos]